MKTNTLLLFFALTVNMGYSQILKHSIINVEGDTLPINLNIQKDYIFIFYNSRLCRGCFFDLNNLISETQIDTYKVSIYAVGICSSIGYATRISFNELNNFFPSQIIKKSFLISDNSDTSRNNYLDLLSSRTPFIIFYENGLMTITNYNECFDETEMNQNIELKLKNFLSGN